MYNAAPICASNLALKLHPMFIHCTVPLDFYLLQCHKMITLISDRNTSQGGVVAL